VSDRTIIVAALIIGGAILASSFQSRIRYTMSASGNVAWRMDTWSGNVDLCAVSALPSGRPLVRCGAYVVVPTQDGTPTPQPAEPAGEQTLPSPLVSPDNSTL
jgi:hypothetical protein